MIEQLNLAKHLLENLGEDPSLVAFTHTSAKINEIIEVLNRLEEMHDPNYFPHKIPDNDGSLRTSDDRPVDTN